MPSFIDAFLTPMRNQAAQVLICALIMLSFLDVIVGVLNAWCIQHDFKSSVLRAGIIKKIINLIIVLAAIVIDAVMLTGIDMTWLPFSIPDGSIVVFVTTSFVAMEVSSLLEIYAKSHPEASESPLYQMLAKAKGVE